MVSVLIELVQESYSNGSYHNTALLNLKPFLGSTRRRFRDPSRRTRRRQQERERGYAYKSRRGTGGFGHRHALVVAVALGFANPGPPLGRKPDGSFEAIQKLLEAVGRAEIPVAFTTAAYRESGKLIAPPLPINSRPSPRETASR